MTEKDKIIIEFITEMLNTAPDDCMRIKLVLLAHFAEKAALTRFFETMFQMIEARRPRLIEMKE